MKIVATIMKGISLFALVIVCLVLASLIFGDADEPSVSTPAVEGGTYEATPVATPEVGSYENPVPLGETLISSTKALSIRIDKIKRGAVVNNMVQRENMFNDAPRAGYEYMLVGVMVKYRKLDRFDADDKFLLSGDDFDAYANGVECDAPWVVLPDEFDTPSSASMMPGSATTIWLVYEVPKGEHVTIAYDRLFVEDVYYFDAGTGNFG